MGWGYAVKLLPQERVINFPRSKRVHWTSNDRIDLSGKVCIVTGGNTGLGLSNAQTLAQRRALVILACRNAEKANGAATRIRAVSPGADVRVGLLDLSRLASVREFAARVARDHAQVDLLINNAGVMMPPKTMTEDGFESQLAINYLGHFLLTRLLLPMISKSPDARVVTLSSVAHRNGQIDFDNLNAERSYSRWGAYAQSKLACLIFALELQRRLRQLGSRANSLAAHPGASSTELARHMTILQIVEKLIAQPTDAGAMPTLRAALDPAARGGEFYGPKYFFGLRGPPVLELPKKQALDEHVARKLWMVSERLVGIDTAS